MALKIIPASDQILVENIVLTAYAAPGLGKTSLAFTAEKPLMLDFDRGAYRAAARGDSVQPSTWSEVSLMTAEDLKPYSTIVVDTAGRALDMLSADIIANNPKAGRGDGSLTLQGFGTLKSRFAQWQSFLRSLKKDLVLICHMDEQKQGDDTLERIDAQGASRNEIYKSSDAMCRIRLDGKDQRYLDFDPRQGGFGKNPAQLGKIPFLDPHKYDKTLADVLKQIKESINHMTLEQAEARKTQERWTKVIAEAKTVAEFNGFLPQLRELKNLALAAMVRDAAGKLGFKYEGDKRTGKYVEAA